MDWHSLPVTNRFTTVLQTQSLRSADPRYQSVSSMLVSDMLKESLGWSFVLIDVFVIVKIIKHFMR